MEEAAKWLRKASDRGNADAQYSLGLIYAIGAAVPRDQAEAMKWYRKAADQGDAIAQYSLGIMFLLGHGVPKDFIRAHAFLNVAAAKGNEGAKNELAKLEQQMTEDQISKAKELARELFLNRPTAPVGKRCSREAGLFDN